METVPSVVVINGNAVNGAAGANGNTHRQVTPVVTTVATENTPRPTDTIRRLQPVAQHGGHIPRQTTFGFIPAGVARIVNRVRGNTSSVNIANMSVDRLSRTSSSLSFMVPSWLAWLDGSAVCYFFIAGFMIGIGLTISVLTLTRDKTKIKHTAYHQNDDAVVWIVGPVFIGCGLLVFGKAIAHIHRRLHPRPPSENGHVLGSDSRPSLTRAPTGLPPTYSQGVLAPFPSGILIEDDDLAKPADYANNHDQTSAPALAQSAHNSNTTNATAGSSDGPGPIDDDEDDLGLVTINFTPQPPTYEEALEMLAQQRSSSDPELSAVPTSSRSPDLAHSVSSNWRRPRLMSLTVHNRRPILSVFRRRHQDAAVAANVPQQDAATTAEHASHHHTSAAHASHHHHDTTAEHVSPHRRHHHHHAPHRREPEDSDVGLADFSAAVVL